MSQLSISAITGIAFEMKKLFIDKDEQGYHVNPLFLVPKKKVQPNEYDFELLYACFSKEKAITYHQLTEHGEVIIGCEVGESDHEDKAYATVCIPLPTDLKIESTFKILQNAGFQSIKIEDVKTYSIASTDE
jgi:hypothetical protein